MIGSEIFTVIDKCPEISAKIAMRKFDSWVYEQKYLTRIINVSTNIVQLGAGFKTIVTVVYENK